MVKTFKVNETTMIFNINTKQLIDKFSKLMESSLTLNFLRDYFNDIKDKWNENSNEFK